MPQTPNHGYNVPEEGATDWHEPLNENFEQYDTDIEVRDLEGNSGDYQPKSGTKFFATDSGKVFVGDGSSWTPVLTTGLRPTLMGINPDGSDLGVGNANPATRLHVTDNTAKTGSMDLSRPAAVVENTSGDPKGDLLGLKTRVTNPGSQTDFLSFIGGSRQLGQLNGNGSTGIRLGATGDLTLSAGGTDAVTVDGGSATVEVGDLETERSSPALHLKDRKATSERMKPLLRLERDSYNPGIDFVSQDSLDARFRPNQNAFQFEILLEKDPLNNVYIGGGGLEVEGSKDFVQEVDTEDGKREVVYTATEAPAARTEVSGVAAIEDGRVEIALPDHFGWVTDASEPIHVQTTPHATDSAGLAVVERSPERIVVADLDGTGDYEFSYTVSGTREGHADKEVVREPAESPPPEPSGVTADD